MNNQIVAHNDLKIRIEQVFFTSAESNTLLESFISKLPWESMTIKMFGRDTKIPRLQCWIGDEGCEYRYSGKQLNRQIWNQDLTMIRKKIFKELKIDFNSVLANYYRDGKDSMGWHSDDEKELGPNPTIASISFGSERDLVFRNKISKKTLTIPQTNGCLILIDGETQKNWQHSIKKTQKIIGPRINLTFRNIIHKNNF
ncbi:alpha-ketoglutarate-dependent dioxygenase AlkB [Gammaproteobacteria bacterium]|jgi:alkylated DNA repair dioxygenase AlkB|nr:alpha-ketoglutarate-dependent dioxygenase AlkB [Gammaproteobacteria bacterium]